MKEQDIFPFRTIVKSRASCPFSLRLPTVYICVNMEDQMERFLNPLD